MTVIYGCCFRERERRIKNDERILTIDAFVPPVPNRTVSRKFDSEMYERTPTGFLTVLIAKLFADLRMSHSPTVRRDSSTLQLLLGAAANRSLVGRQEDSAAG